MSVISSNKRGIGVPQAYLNMSYEHSSFYIGSLKSVTVFYSDAALVKATLPCLALPTLLTMWHPGPFSWLSWTTWIAAPGQGGRFKQPGNAGICLTAEMKVV